MLYRLYLPTEWMLSPTARRVYMASSIATLLLFGTFLGSILAISAADQSFADLDPLVAAMLRVFLFIGMLGAAVLWIGMLYYWFNYHPSGAALIFLLLGPPAALIYHFVVYRRRTRQGSVSAGESEQNRAAGA